MCGIQVIPFPNCECKQTGMATMFLEQQSVQVLRDLRGEDLGHVTR